MNNPIKALVLGAGGMLGHQLCRQLAQRLDLWGTVQGNPERYHHFNFLAAERLIGGVDALRMEQVQHALDAAQPQVVINAIGIVKQRDEARQAVPSIQTNSLFPHLLAQACSERGIRLVHISTDCVFSGSSGAYTEADMPDPVDLYGRSKLLGELNKPGSLTLRTSIIGWELSARSGLLEWFAAQRGRHIKGYQNAIFSGFTSAVLANLIGDLIETRPDLHGLYHVASQPVSKYDLLVRLREALGWDDIHISPDTSFYCDRSLAAGRFESTTGWRPPAWNDMIAGLAHDWPVYAALRGENS